MRTCECECECEHANANMRMRMPMRTCECQHANANMRTCEHARMRMRMRTCECQHAHANMRMRTCECECECEHANAHTRTPLSHKHLRTHATHKTMYLGPLSSTQRAQSARSSRLGLKREVIITCGNAHSILGRFLLKKRETASKALCFQA